MEGRAFCIVRSGKVEMIKKLPTRCHVFPNFTFFLLYPVTKSDPNIFFVPLFFQDVSMLTFTHLAPVDNSLQNDKN